MEDLLKHEEIIDWLTDRLTDSLIILCHLLFLISINDLLNSKYIQPECGNLHL